MKITDVPLDQIIPYPGNPRRNEDAVATVAMSIREFGWQNSIVVDAEMVVLAGHTRLLAAKLMGLETAPVHIIRALLLQVNGALSVDSMVVIQTLKAVEMQLRDVASDGQSAETMRRYLGADSLTRLVYACMLARHLNAYDDRWLPMLAKRQAEIETLRADTQARARAATEADARATCEKNAGTQQTIL